MTLLLHERPPAFVFQEKTMYPFSGRRTAARTFTSFALTALFVAAGLSLVPLRPAMAQHSGHQGHEGHRGHGGKKKSPAKKRGSGAGVHHAGHRVSASDTPAVAEFKTAHASMMRGMDLPYTGDADADFRIQMIPHHQGAIDMAQVAMRHAKDPWTRQLAEAVIVEQQREIAEMQAWLGRRGIAAPPGGQPGHIITSSSYRHLDEDAGTREEARGASWAPGSGVPAAR